MADRVFVGWTDHGRSRELAEVLGAVNMPVTAKRGSKPGVKYLDLIARTWQALKAVRPSVVFFMQPPAPLLLVVVAYAVTHRGVLLVGDLHSGFFNDNKWSWFSRLGLRLLKRHAVLVTNQNMADQAADLVGRVYVLHDLIDIKRDRPAPGAQNATPYMVCPLSYAADEPLEDLIGAARLTPEVNWIFTGRAPDWIANAAPSNVVLPGFVSDEDYVSLLEGAAGLVALTRRADTMQRAGYEAMSYAIPLIISDQLVLRSFFEPAAIFVQHTPEELAAAARDMLANPQIADRMIDVRSQRILEQSETIAEIRRNLLHE